MYYLQFSLCSLSTCLVGFTLTQIPSGDFSQIYYSLQYSLKLKDISVLPQSGRPCDTALSHTPLITSRILRMVFLDSQRLIYINQQMLLQSQVCQGSRFLEFVLSAAREHYLSPDFPRRPIWEQFGPSFLTTTFVRKLSYIQIRGFS